MISVVVVEESLLSYKYIYSELQKKKKNLVLIIKNCGLDG
jgi:hypothetical protein